MSPQRKRELATWIAILVGVVTLATAANAWAKGTFVTSARYDRDRTADSAWKSEQRELALETFCTLQPKSRRCR